MSEDKLSDPKYIVLITASEETLPLADLGLPSGPGADEELHGKIIDTMRRFFPGASAVDFEKVKANWERINKQTRELLASALKETPNGFRLDEVSFSFGLTAKGNIGLVGAGANASITLKFKKG